MIRRTYLFSIFIITAALALVACSGGTTLDVAEEPAQEVEAAPESDAEEVAADEPVPEESESATRTFTDDLGREVVIPAEVLRVIPLAPSVTESLYAIGAGALVVGRTDFDNFPAEVTDLPSVGGFSADDISVEIIVSLEPDLVIGGSSLQEPLIASFEAAGIPYYLSLPDSIEDIYDALTVFGEITANEEGATAVVEDMQTRIAAVQETVAQVAEDERPTVFYEVWDEPLLTAGPDTYIGQMIVIAGGVDIFSDIDVPWSEVSTEAVIERQPAVIMGPTTHAEGMTVEVLSSRPGWNAIPAVQNGSVFLFHDDLTSRPSPRVVEGIELIAISLYPDLF